ncbi:calcium-binding protein [Nocardioides sp. 503]|uniref:calcium-binding protein n=1 Tax=Nocardioides sp. 503 TaxID=2508326 RepID=UPI00106FC738|nr:calcium-binding protein [Nocardioides sp. 503]
MVTIRAAASNSTVLGTDGPDVIDGMGHFALRIQGLGGDDVICSGDGTYVVIGGGDGDDRIEAGGPGGYAVALGAAGDDQLVFVGDRGGSGGGGGGDDRIVDATTGKGSGDVVRVRPGGGDDTVVGRRGSTELVFRGATGVRISVAEGTADGEGHDTFSGIERYVGTQSSDTFLGSSGRDAFVGGTRSSAGAVGGAPDVAYGADGADTLTLTGRAEGGEGGDRVQVHGRRSVAIGGPGDDELYVEAGRTCTSPAACDVRVDAGAGQDGITLRPRDRRGVRVDLNLGRARLRGGRVSFVGVEKVYGTPYRDVLIGDDRRNTLVGEGGGDLMRGRGSRDVLVGRHGQDRAEGGAGRDRCEAEVRRSC